MSGAASVGGTGPVGGGTAPVGWGRLDRARGIARHAAGRALRPVLERCRRPGIEALEQIAVLDQAISSQLGAQAEWHTASQDLHNAEVNLDLLKAEVRSLERIVEDLGRSIAPATGLAGATDALAELRARVTACERRLRSLEAPSRPTPTPAVLPHAGLRPQGATIGQPSPAGPNGIPGVDPAVLRRRFRGEPAALLTALDERYGALLGAHPPVLDIECGRGDLVARLVERGVPATGVTTDAALAAEAQARGVDVVLGDAVDVLRAHAVGTLGAIVSSHGIEHLALDPLIEMLELSATRLQPGGLLIAETLNPATLIVLGTSYVLDPTNVRPVHPKLLEFLCEAAGFRDIEVRFFEPATDLQIEMLSNPEAQPWVSQVNAGLERLNSVLFGPVDYAVIATAGKVYDVVPE